MLRPGSRYEKIINDIKSKNLDVAQRNISLKTGNISIFYVKQLTDRIALSEQVIKPLVEHSGNQNIKASDVIESIIFADDCLLDTDENKIETYILNGRTILLFSNDVEYVVIDLRKIEKRSISEPQVAYTIRGPRDAFIEDIDSNISLVRFRIKDDNLRVVPLEVGKRSKTKVMVLYLDDVANKTCVAEVKKRITDIKIDGLCSSGELQAFMLNKKVNLFPQMGIVERPDMACGALLEGKVIVIMDGSPWVLVAPKVFSEYLWSCDDFYLNKYFSMFLRILRVIALNLAFVVSSIYVGVVSFHSDVLPSRYMMAIAQAREKVPFNALVEVLLIELIVELIRESLVRVPSKIGTAIGIVGAIIIGEAAISAGIFSPLLLIVISMSLISSFVPADYTIMDPFRVLKFLLIFATGIFGFYGFTLVIFMVAAELVSINTFGVPYMAPIAPFIFKDFIKSIFYSKSTAPVRPAYLRTKDNTRMPVKKNRKKQKA